MCLLVCHSLKSKRSGALIRVLESFIKRDLTGLLSDTLNPKPPNP